MKPIIRPIRGLYPEIEADVFLAENAVIIGEVSIGTGSSIWYNVVLRGDVHRIQIGQHTNIQDGTIVHCTYQKAPTHIGNYVTVGHSAVIHGCTLQDRVLIGMGAIVLDHAIIESHAIVAAGALVRSGTVVESGSLYAGIPARKVKDLDDDMIASIQSYADHYSMYKQWYLDDQTHADQPNNPPQD